MSQRSGGGSSSSTSNPLQQHPYIVKRSYSTPCSDNSEGIHNPQQSSRNMQQQSSKTPPLTPLNNNNNNNNKNNNNNAKMVAIKILLLDDSVTVIQAQSKALGRLVFDQICKQLNILEQDYFGLEYVDEGVGVTYWLDLEKRLTRQVGLSMSEPMLKFSVKFYTPDPSQLEEEFTRYLFSLQIKRDLATGVLVCNDNTAGLMASYIVQAECGDYSEEDYPDASYLSVYKFVPHQNYDLERKIRENHKKHIGQSPAEADLHLLETARRTEIYGVRVHPAKDEDGVNLNLSVCHMGVVVFQNMTKINTFSWAKIRKISFKRKRFILKLHPETYQGYYKELVEFIFDSRNECKAYWKRCVEHHAFFRCEKAPNPIHRSKGILSSRGSSFRYSGRTQKQMVAFVRENFVKRPNNQYHSMSQQNLSTIMGGGAPSSAAAANFDLQLNRSSGQSALPLNFQRSSSFKTQQQQQQQGRGMYDDQQRPGMLGSQQVVSNSRSSPAMITDERHQTATTTTARQNYTQQDDDDEEEEEEEEGEEEEEEEEFSDYVVEGKSGVVKGQRSGPLGPTVTTGTSTITTPDTSVTSSPVRAEEYNPRGQPGLQQQSEPPPPPPVLKKQLLPPDWYYYLNKELLNMYRTYKTDMLLLKQYYPQTSDNPHNNNNSFIIGVLGLCRVLKQNMEELKKEHWEERNGDEILYQLAKHFEQYQQSYLDYFNNVHLNYESICESDKSNHYIGKCCLYLRPFEFIRYVFKDVVLRVLKSTTAASSSPGKVDTTTPANKIRERLQKSVENLYATSNQLKPALLSTYKCIELFREMNVPKFNSNFIRQGILLKLNKKRGLQNRIFFLFRDVLCYGSRINSSEGFRLHGLILTSQLEVSETNQVEISGIPHSFVVNVANNNSNPPVHQPPLINSSQQNINSSSSSTNNHKILVLAAFSQKDKEGWTGSIEEAIRQQQKNNNSKKRVEGLMNELMTSYNSSEEVLKCDITTSTSNPGGTQQHRSNATTHVCWHRNLTISADAILMAYGVTISGYLLRKFKNSPGWQRLWVVYTNICLYFYKTHSASNNNTESNEEDPPPLASLPLLGYRVSEPTEEDGISKEHVFKLCFKNHVYFFRAESPFTFQRWVEAISRSSTPF